MVRQRHVFRLLLEPFVAQFNSILAVGIIAVKKGSKAKQFAHQTYQTSSAKAEVAFGRLA